MMIVTGAAGFIGSYLIKQLNQAGYENILAVDDLTEGIKYRNLAMVRCADYQDYEDFLACIEAELPFREPVEAVFHQGACSDTTQWNGRYMMDVNFTFSKSLFNYCVEQEIPFIYASSAAVYGANEVFDDQAKSQFPLNVYGYSKWLFDQYVLQQLPYVRSPVIGLRYFNVYGPHEQHKGSMASVAFHFMNQLKESDRVRLFKGWGGYRDGEQLRDFVFVEDVAQANVWFFENRGPNGIYNLGTGRARTFNDVAQTLIRLHGKGEVEYIPFPEHLKGAYQNFTQADLSSLRKAGYINTFESLESGLEKYYQWYLQNAKLMALAG